MPFTHPPIHGIKPKTTLPQGIALVCEGGGTRGFYSAGVFEAFMDEGLMFPYIIGVSAGAANALSYVSGQPGRNRQILEFYVGDKRYVSKRNLFRHGTLFGYDFIFKTVPQNHIFWDNDNFLAAETHLLTGVTDCETGLPAWFGKNELGNDFHIARSSCSVPLIGKIVHHDNRAFLDGGISAPIPITKAIEDGNTKFVIVLTRNKGYTKPPFKHKRLLKFVYRKYPKLAEALINRHTLYNNQLALCEQLEAEGKAIIIRPQQPLTVDTTATNIKKLLALHDEGHAEGRAVISKIMKL